jgi:DNA-binding protein H-NS
MPTLKSLQDQIAELQQQAEIARTHEIQGAVAEIKALMKEFGLTINDLNIKSKKSGKQAKPPQEIQFRNEIGDTWSGRGRMPTWIKGLDKEKFRAIKA